MPSRRTQFTSESVAVGHPDKAADQVSDAILDAVLAQDPDARVACEVMLTGGLGVIAGEITASAAVDFEEIARDTLRGIGYTAESGFDPDHTPVEVHVNKQSPDIAVGVDRDTVLGAGDQGMMFGYACRGEDHLMPLPIVLAHRLVERQAEVRRSETIPGLRPDAKSQVTVDYEGSRPVGIRSVVLSTQHDERWDGKQGQADLAEAVTEHVIRPVLGDWWTTQIDRYVNPTGRFNTGGPEGDTGVTGRKIIVDTYGGWARHGGGAFSGKDPSKVDRSASYMARYIAKNVVAAGLASECEVRLGYAIGVAEPTMVSLDCKGSETDGVDEAALEAAVRTVFGLTPGEIIATLGLRNPIYLPTAAHGHFGRTPDEPGQGFFTWERVDRVEELRAAL